MTASSQSNRFNHFQSSYIMITYLKKYSMEKNTLSEIVEQNVGSTIRPVETPFFDGVWNFLYKSMDILTFLEPCRPFIYLVNYLSVS